MPSCYKRQYINKPRRAITWSRQPIAHCVNKLHRSGHKGQNWQLSELNSQLMGCLESWKLTPELTIHLEKTDGQLTVWLTAILCNALLVLYLSEPHNFWLTDFCAAVSCSGKSRLVLSFLVFGRPYYRSSLWYSMSSVCLSVCLSVVCLSVCL